MRSILCHILLALLLANSHDAFAQVDEDQMGAWYMYFFDARFAEDGRWGVQGDIQYRNWDLGGDLEQLLLRGGLTYRPEGTSAKLTLGFSHITTGTSGPSDRTTAESRIYQEALLPQSVGGRLSLNHRFRYEQRFVDDQDFRTRYRYNLFVTLPLTDKKIKEGTMYLSLYNEIFINGQRQIGDGRQVEIFDRNRTYGALGYALSSNCRVQFGIMRQTNDSYAKDQLQLSLHQQF